MASALLAAALVGAPVASVPSVAVAAAPSQPNIVVVITDDQSIGMMSAMPRVRRLLGSRGVTFPMAVVPTSLCCPSRAAFFTGRYAHETDIWRNIPPHGGWETFNGSGVETETVAVWLQRLGYHTALVGKYLNGFDTAPAAFAPPGWDSIVTYDGEWNGRYFNYRLRTVTDSGSSIQEYGSQPDDYSTDVFAGRAVAAIESAPADRPLFLVFTPYAAHAPYTPAPRHLDTWPRREITSPAFNEADVSDKPSWIQQLPLVSRRQATEDTALRMETLRAVDDAVGSIHAALGSRATNTLFVFTSDNGLSLGEHRWLGKNVPHAQASRVPLIIRWDGHLAPGVSDGRLALNIDITATIVAAAGLDIVTSGRSLLGASTRRGTVLEAIDAHSPNPAYCGWRTRRWMFVEYSDGLGRELYDYRQDPYELNNLAGKPRYRDQLHRLRDRAIDACSPVPPGFTW